MNNQVFSKYWQYMQKLAEYKTQVELFMQKDFLEEDDIRSIEQKRTEMEKTRDDFETLLFNKG